MEIPERYGTNVPQQPTVPPIPNSSKSEDLKNIEKELHKIANELHLLNQILRRN